MITPSINSDGYTGNILLEPNRPISWQDNLRFIKIFALLSSLIAGIFIYGGFYLVLPYSGLEILCLSFALYIVYRHYSVCQVIHFTRDSVVIESGDRKVSERIEYQRFWSKFHIDNQGNFNIPRITIQSKGKSTEIGRFLSYHDKQILIHLLRELTLHFQQSKL